MPSQVHHHPKRPRKAFTVPNAAHDDDPFLTGLSKEDISAPSDLFNRQTLLSSLENVVQYRIHLPATAVRNEWDAIGGANAHANKEWVNGNAKTLSEWSALVMGFVQRWTEGHLWQCEGFWVEGGIEGLESDQPFLTGKTRFGDCIDDEWFIVFLLKEITIQWPEMIVSVQDNDGQFLLIEAAHHIPPSLDPENSQNRCFLHKGRIHVIPPPPRSTTHLDLSTALNMIRSDPAKTQAGDEVEKCISKRVDVFPAKLKEMRHRVVCLIPRDIARVLKWDKGLAAKAVEAFYLRDLEEVKSLQTMSRFHPSTNVRTLVHLTRPLYAQLVAHPTQSTSTPMETENITALMTSSVFYPPKPFRGLMPGRNDSDFRAFDVGMRLACGFEILIGRMKEEIREGMTVESWGWNSDKKWRGYLERLKDLGYFKDELPGSKLYKSLERTAKEQYLSNLNRNASANVDSDDEDEEPGAPRNRTADPIQRLHHALRVAPDFQEADLENVREDKDDWLMLDAKGLEEELGGMSGKIELEDLGDELMEDDEEVGEEEKMARRRGLAKVSKVVGGFKEFLGRESGLGGALFPDEMDSDDDDDFLAGDDNEEEELGMDELLEMQRDLEEMDEGDDDDKPVQLDMERLMKAVMNVLSIDESVLKPINRKQGGPSSALGSDARRKKKNVPVVPPADFDATRLLSRPSEQTEFARAVGKLWEDDGDDGDDVVDGEDDDVEVLDYKRKLRAVRGHRKGLQEVEWDSEDEKEEERLFEKGFLEGLRKEERVGASMEGVEEEEEEVKKVRFQVKNIAEEGLRDEGKLMVIENDEDQNEQGQGKARTLAYMLSKGNEPDSDDESDVDMGMEEYLAAMDLELKGSKIGRDFNTALEPPKVDAGRPEGVRGGMQAPKWNEGEERVVAVPNKVKGWEQPEVSGVVDGAVVVDLDDEEEQDDGDDETKEVRLDANLVKNLMESFQAQNGLGGPAGNLLGRLGVYGLE
ncbi:hypothetical protein HDU97_002918 [Phlyctochytrium planicorne]|nr:hypothetical protein HDU97_002918 [Phlyctochytrium planicorne]